MPYVTLNISGNNTSVTLDSSQDLRSLSVPIANPGDQSLDLHSPSSPGAFNAVRVYGSGLAATKSALWQAIKLASNPESPTPLDGVFDSGAAAHPGSRLGIALIRDAHNDQHVEMRLTRIGDLNLDGAVTIADFIDLASHFGSTNATWQEGDMNYDSAVTITDFIDLASNFNTTYAGDVFPISAADQQTLSSFAAAHGAQSVPEPASFLFVTLSAATLLGRRRCRAS
jgi:hypothetical protein